MIISDTEGMVLYMNPEALRLHGFDDMDQVRRGLREWPEFELRTLGGEVVSVDDWPLARAIGGERFSQDVVQVHNLTTGTVSAWSYSGSPVFEDGRMVRAVLTVRDVSERRRLAEELDSERRRLRGIMDSAPIGIALVSPSGAVLEVNPANGRIWHTDAHPMPKTLEGYRVFRGWDFETGRELQANDWPVGEVLRTGEEVIERLVEVERFDGTRGTISISAIPVTDEFGGVENVVVLTEDVTARIHEIRLDAALAEIDALIHSTLDFSEIVQRALQAACHAVDASWGNIAGFDEAHGAVILHQYPPQRQETHLGQDFDRRQVPFVEVLRRGRQPLLIGDTSGSPLFGPQLKESQGAVAFIGVPLVIRAEVPAGLLMMFDRPKDFDDLDYRFAERLGGSISIALDNARLYEERDKSFRDLEEKDHMIRKAYSDVIDAVTGGRLVLLGEDELEDELPAGVEPLGEVRDAEDVGRARADLRPFLKDVPEGDGLLVACAEALTNALKHAGGGSYLVEKDEEHVRVVVSDKGPGIDFSRLPKATLLSGYSTKQTLGMGFTLMMELTDRLLLCTDEDGTTLVLEKDLHRETALL